MSEQEELKQLRIDAVKIGLKCYESFYFFFITFWPEMSGDKYIDAPHIKYICDVIQEKAMKVINREVSMETLIINVPPGSSKSTIATIAFPMWVWLRAPWLASTNVSYSDTLSARHAKKARAITDSKKWNILFTDIFKEVHGKAFEITTQNKKAIENNFKGERFNTSVGGTITGMHADFIIKDDMQNPKTAKSDTEREAANEWDEETLTSRHKNEMCYLDIIIAQRLHESDLTGYTLNKDISITQLCLPSEVNNASKVLPPEAIDIYTDGILDPNRRPKFVLDALKAKSGSASYTCQYLQTPFNLDEQDITPKMFEIIESLNVNVTWDIWIDGAYTEKTENDPTGIDVIARVGNDIVVRESFDKHLALPKLVAFVQELATKDYFNPLKSRIFIEPKASGYSLYQYLINDTEFNCVLIGQDNKVEAKLIQEGKTSRHNMIIPKAQSHRIKLFKGKWNDDFIVQLSGFPRAAYDEHVDTMGYAVNHYFHKENSFIEQWAIDKLDNNIVDSFPVEITSQQMIARNGHTKLFEVDYKDRDSGDVQMYDYPNAMYSNRYICVVVVKSEAERNGTSCVMVYDRMNKSVVALYDVDMINPRKIAMKSLELAHLYNRCKLVVCVKKSNGQAKNEENDISHMVIQNIRKIGYSKLHTRYSINNVMHTTETEYGFEVNVSTLREVYMHLKDQAETQKIKELPQEVFDDITKIERKKESGAIDAREGHEINRGLAFSVALKVDDEWSSKPVIRKAERYA